MKIAYVINSVEGGGASSPVPAITQVFRNCGAEVYVFALTPRDRRGLAAMHAAGLNVLVREGGTKDHLAAGRWLNHMIGAWHPTHIWTSLTRATLLGQLVGMKRRLPVISWQHAAFLKPANLALLRSMQKLSRLWVGDSDSVTSLTQKRLHVPEDRLTCWPIFAADARAPQAQPWQSGQTLSIGSLGRLHPVKGYDVLIAALAKLKTMGFTSPISFQVHIGGEGGERERLVAAITDAGLDNIRLSGFVDRPRAFLQSQHLYVQPSLSEGFCIAVHEAMQAGVPVLASAVGEIPYTIGKDQGGFTVPPGNVTALAKGLATVLSNPNALHKVGHRGREIVLEKFSSDQFAERGRSIIDRIAQW